jgi:hypothetical protein
MFSRNYFAETPLLSPTGPNATNTTPTGWESQDIHQPDDDILGEPSLAAVQEVAGETEAQEPDLLEHLKEGGGAAQDNFGKAGLKVILDSVRADVEAGWECGGLDVAVGIPGALENYLACLSAIIATCAARKVQLRAIYLTHP